MIRTSFCILLPILLTICAHTSTIEGSSFSAYASVIELLKNNGRFAQNNVKPTCINLPDCSYHRSDPQCGDDGVIYLNTCQLAQLNCNVLTGVSNVELRNIDECKRKMGVIRKKRKIHNEAPSKTTNKNKNEIQSGKGEVMNSSCSHRCKPHYDPVCGSNGQTYLNKCYLQVQFCKRGTKFSHYGTCISQQRTHKHKSLSDDSNKNNLSHNAKKAEKSKIKNHYNDENNNFVFTHICPKVCKRPRSIGRSASSSIKPVCASDGNVYESECELRRLTCGENVVKVDGSHCLTTVACKNHENHVSSRRDDDQCDQDYNLSHAKRVLEAISAVNEMKKMSSRRNGRKDGHHETNYALALTNTIYNDLNGKVRRGGKKRSLTCASNGKLYNNACQMRRKNCGQHIFEIPLGHCLNKQLSYSVSRYRVEKRRRQQQGCPSECPEDGELVKLDGDSSIRHLDNFKCASDGNVYTSVCQMKKLTCGFPLIRFDRVQNMPIRTATCESKISHCLSMISCGREDQSGIDNDNDDDEIRVCGSDGRTYANLCHLQKMTCLTSDEVRLAHVGTCQNYVDTTTPAKDGEYDEVKEDCTCREEGDTNKPVCGSDGNVYKSKCAMIKQTCGQRVVIAANTFCETTRFCDADCTGSNESSAQQHYSSTLNDTDVNGIEGGLGRGGVITKHPYVDVDFHLVSLSRRGKLVRHEIVCGSDGLFYQSECEMRKVNCGRHIYQAPMTHCLESFKFVFNGCKKICPNRDEPVCGSDGNTYSNPCFMEIEHCRSRGRVKQKYFGRCGNPKNSDLSQHHISS